jgi:superfamily II RNA helicase
MVLIKNSPYNDSNYTHYFESFSSFPLSDFQKHAIQAIVDGNHVLVTAHTGSGKTLPAEFAIRHFTALGRRVIYTAPIKALSNQKFYDFTRKFPDISFGIITGDIKSNPDAQVLIMTTEILLNMLISGGGGGGGAGTFQIDIERELAAVIFDEVHYINDADRGKTWEQTILMLPPHIQLIMLSATIDAPERFADWVESRHPYHPARVVLTSTYERVVPLVHYGFLTTNEGYVKSIKDKAAQQELRAATNNFLVLHGGGATAASSAAAYAKIAAIKKNPYFPAPPRAHVLNTLARKLYEQDMMPAIVFVFSRKMVERYAAEISVNLFQAPLDEFRNLTERPAELNRNLTERPAELNRNLTELPAELNRAPPAAADEISLYDDSKIPYIVARECEQILRAKLPNYREYMELPEYVTLVALLEKGIAIHHAGMLPILREIVEFMISKKYVKLLFATESFAIGLDCPIKTAVFTSLEKFDGNGKRIVYPHEYSQMAGRAGRRGRDQIGHVIHCNNLFDLPTATEYKEIMAGNPQTLISKFKVKYTLILKSLDTCKTAADLEAFIKKSMFGREIADDVAHSRDELEKLRAQLGEKEKSLEFLKTPKTAIEQYFAVAAELPRAQNKKRRALEKQKTDLLDMHRNLVADAKYMEAYMELLDDIKSKESYIKYLSSEYLRNQIAGVLNILCECGLVSAAEAGGEYTLTPYGNIAARLGEFNPIVFIEFMRATDWCADFSAEEIAAIFSCMVDITVPEDKRRVLPNILVEPLTTLKSIFDKYVDIENERELYTNEFCATEMQYELPELVYIWARDCTNELECKIHIQTLVADVGISVGDFSKALLKISNMAREISVLCEELRPDFAAKLAKIDGAILKYVVTLQSLYI